MSVPRPEFVTVAEAARRLGIGERRAYRLTEKLSDSDKQVSDTGKRQTLVNVNALSDTTLSDSPVDGKKVSSVRQNPVRQSKVSDTQMSDSNKQVSDSKDALIEQLKIENTRLAEALATSQRLTDQAQQLQLMTERRAASLEAEVQQLKALPAMQTETAQNAHNRDSTGDPTPGGQVDTPAPEVAQAGHKKRRGFWRSLADSFTGSGG